MTLRLGVVGAIVNEKGAVLLSQRGDFNIWNLPGGRLDTGEWLAEAAAREVYEETGVVAHIERPVNLYYWPDFQRMNILYVGWPTGGVLRSRTDETLDNRYCATDRLPRMLLPQQVDHALAARRPLPEIIDVSAVELRRIRRRLGLRWIGNLLRGQPEPKFPHFHVRAVAIIFNHRFQRVLTVTGEHGPVLPRVACTGLQSPWDELRARLMQHCQVRPLLQWVGVWQDASLNLIELVFAAQVPETVLPANAEWGPRQNSALGDRDLLYLQRTSADYQMQPVWSVAHTDAELMPGSVIKLDRMEA